MKNPLKRISALEFQVADLHAALATTSTQLTEQAEQIKALIRDDAQIEALRRIQTATEYVANAERHDRQSAMKRHEF
jgi:hypothetical protein